MDTEAEIKEMEKTLVQMLQQQSEIQNQIDEAWRKRERLRCETFNLFRDIGFKLGFQAGYETARKHFENNDIPFFQS